jgi:hypothetical protein
LDGDRYFSGGQVAVAAPQSCVGGFCAGQFQVGAWPVAEREQDRLAVAGSGGQAAGQAGEVRAGAVSALRSGRRGDRHHVYAVQQCRYHVAEIGAWLGDHSQSGHGYAQLGRSQQAQVGHADDGRP